MPSMDSNKLVVSIHPKPVILYSLASLIDYVIGIGFWNGSEHLLNKIEDVLGFHTAPPVKVSIALQPSPLPRTHIFFPQHPHPSVGLSGLFLTFPVGSVMGSAFMLVMQRPVADTGTSGSLRITAQSPPPFPDRPGRRRWSCGT
jgi:hypothetical protein